MKTGAVISFYNDPSILRCLPTIAPHLDCIIIVDGKYTESDFQDDYSNPDLIKTITDYYSNVVIFQCVGTEPEKRNMCLKHAESLGITHMLIIDSDEWINTEKSDWNLFWVRCIDLETGIYGISYKPSGGYFPRLWVNPQNYEYFNAHCIFRNKQTNDVFSSGNSAKINIDGIELEMDDKLRSKEYIDGVWKYQYKMIAKEEPFRKALV